MAKQILFDDSARQKMRVGIEKLARTVRVTLGPAGRNVDPAEVLRLALASPRTASRSRRRSSSSDPFENMGAKLVREVANKTNDVAGDGTTTATVLAAAIFNEGLKYLATGVNPIALRNGIEKAVEAAVESIKAAVAQGQDAASEKASVATISANNDPDDRRAARRGLREGRQRGRDHVEEGPGIETELEVVEGMEFDKGYLSPYFATDLAKLTAELEDAYIFIYDKKITQRARVPAGARAGRADRHARC